MEVVEKMIGKWKIVPELTENQSAYLDAMGLPDQMKAEMMKETKIITTITKDGDVITMDTQFGDVNEVLTFTLGQTFKATIAGASTENTFTVEEEVMVGKHDIAGIATVSRKYLQDGKMIAETETKGVVMKNLMEKC